MNFKCSIIAGMLIAGIGMTGCSSGGDDNQLSQEQPLPATQTALAVTSVSGTLGDSGSGGVTGASALNTMADVGSASEGIAELSLDSDGDGKYDGANDLQYSTAIVNGAFAFDDVVVDDNETVTAVLTVTKEGFAPFKKVLQLTKDNAVSVLATVAKPVLKEVIDLSSLSDTQRATSFIAFGTKESGSGMQSFSKLMSLSEFTAMADVNLSSDGTQSQSVIPVGAFASDVKTLNIEMQSFDSSNSDDFGYFPGTLSGHGKPSGVASSATDADEEVTLESAGFDLLKLTDQNGELIQLQGVATSKLSAMAGTEVCGGMQWTRYLRSSEADVIKSWGDDDNNASNGYQVPIWSNDNATRSWQYIGLATVYNLDNSQRAYFTMCVDQQWQGYLNCDSPIATTRPKQLCVYTHDQNDNAIGNVNINGRKGGQYSYGNTASYGDNKGKASLTINDGNITGWEYTYQSALTGWAAVETDPNDITVDTNTSNTCDYNLDIEVQNPYTTRLYVTPYAIDDVNKTTPLGGKRVYVGNSSYADYYSKYRYTDANGTAVFDIKPNVEYKVRFKAAEVSVKADGTVTAPETSDSTREVHMDIQNVNKAPEVSVYIYKTSVSDKAETVNFSVSARDKNYDPLSFNGLKLDNTALVKDTDYTVDYSYSYDGYAYMRGKLNLQSATLQSLGAQLAARENSYVLKANFSDGKLVQEQGDDFYVYENRAPYIGSFYMRREGDYRTYYPYSYTIPEGNYSISAYVSDPDGDKFSVVYTLDGSELTNTNSVALAKGDHNITIVATDEYNNTATDAKSFYVGNRAPVITSAASTNYFVNADNTFTLRAYVSDRDTDLSNVTVKALFNGVEYNLTRFGTYTSLYSSADINISSVTTEANATATFSLRAYDGEDYSDTVNVSVTRNRAPDVNLTVSVDDLDSQTDILDIFSGNAVTFTCNANDPDGAAIYYRWRVNGTYAYAYSNTYTRTFSVDGNYTVTCEVTDRDGASSSDAISMSVTTNNPPVFNQELPETVTLEVGESYELICDASDPNNRGSVSYLWSLNGQTISDVNGSIYTFLAESAGSYSVACTAADVDGLSATTTTTITVVPQNAVPTIENATASVDGDKTVSGTITFGDSDGTATVVASSNVAGFTLNPNTGAYSFDASVSYSTLLRGSTVTVQIPLIVTDNVGATATAVLSITVTGVYELATGDGATKDNVKQMINNPVAGADVNDAKNLFAQLREAKDSFIDLENDFNASTVVGSQQMAFVEVVKPEVDAALADLNGSVARLQGCVESFSTSVDNDFNATLTALAMRVGAIATVLDANHTDTNWTEVTEYNDRVSYTYEENELGIAETVTVNNGAFSVVRTALENGQVISLSKSGEVRLQADGYDLILNALSFDFSTMNAELNATGHIDGDNGAFMDLNTLYTSFSINEAYLDTPLMAENIKATIDGEVSAGGRTLSGVLSLDDTAQTKNKLTGNLTCAIGEPTFSGEIALNVPLQTLKEVATDQESKVDNWSWNEMLMVTYANGETSFVTRMQSSYQYDENTSRSYTNYLFYTQNDKNASCQSYTEGTEIASGYFQEHHFSCADGVTVTPYLAANNIVTVQTPDGNYTAESVWWNYENNSNQIHMWIRNEGEVYYDQNAMMLAGSEFVITGIATRPAKEFKDFDFDVSIAGTLQDGDNTVSARIGLVNIHSKTTMSLYAQDINISRADEVLRADRLSFSMLSGDMQAFLASGGENYWMYNKIEDVYNEYNSEFTDYNVTYSYGTWYEPSVEDFITAIDIKNLSLDVVAATGNAALTIDADLAYNRELDGNESIVFDGSYVYGATATQFNGDLNVSFNRDRDIFNAELNGTIASNGFVPFGLSSVIAVAADAHEGYALLSRGEYKIAIAVVGDANRTVIDLADSNGVISNYEVNTSAAAPAAVIFTDSVGNVLATFGEDVNGNGWEVIYNDGTSETLY